MQHMYVHVPDVSDVVTRRRARSMTQLNGLHGQRSTVGARPRGRFEHMSQQRRFAECRRGETN